MDWPPSPKLDFATIPEEDLSDFISLPWYQTLLKDPTFTPIGNRHHLDKEPGQKRRTFFSDTLWTDSTIRASQCFYKGPMHPERWSGPPRPADAQTGPGECRIVFSLGAGLAGGGPSDLGDSLGGREFAHGGLTATLLDETLGTPVFVQSSGCATGELSVKYERPVPIPGVVLCRSWIERTEGRKAWIEGVLEDGEGVVYVRARSLFIRFRERL